MRKVELHTHTTPMSVCAKVDTLTAVKRYIAHGYDGIMLTNHYTDAHCQVMGVSREEWLES